MDVEKWGSSLWNIMHCIALNSPDKINEEKQLEYTIFYYSLKRVLPCIYCRHSFLVICHFIPLKLFCQDNYGLIYWTYLIHMCVNYKLGKRQIPLYEAIGIYYDKMGKNHRFRKFTPKQIADNINNRYSAKGVSHIKKYIDFVKNHNNDFEEMFQILNNKYNIDQ